MQEDDARALVRRWYEGIWHDGNLDLVEELCTDPYIRHTGLGTERLSHAEYKKRLVQSQRVMKGAATTIHDQVVAGDKIWSRATSKGVNLDTTEASVMTWMVIHRIEDGKLAESWTLTLPGVEWED